MGLSSITRSNFFIRLTNWEYWPFLAVYSPVFIYWLWLSVRARSLFYFTASNPAIENGGMLGESKKSIMDLLPDDIKPQSLIIDHTETKEALQKHIRSITYPIICKPDIGERGRRVQKITTEAALLQYHDESNETYLIQEYLTEPIELGVFYYRYPNQKYGIVSSIVEKEMLTLKGDGKSTLKELILNYDRSKLQWKKLKISYQNQLDKVLAIGEKLNLVAIGNHSKGTKFLSANHLINDQLTRTFDKVSKNITGFYFGRFDLKVASYEDLYAGKIKIMELNGAGSEPAHIYDPSFSLFRAWKVIFHHWKVLFDISVINHKNGVPYLSFKEAWREYQKVKSE